MNYFLLDHLNLLKSCDCGMAMLNPGWCHMERKLEKESVIIIGRKNETVLDDEGTELVIKPGRMILLPAGRFHRGVKKIDTNVNYYWMHFTFGFSDGMKERYFTPRLYDEKEAVDILSNKEISRTRLGDAVLLPQVIDLKKPAEYYTLSSQILQEKRNPGFSTAICSTLIVNLILKLCSESFQDNSSLEGISRSQALVNKVLLLLEENLSDPNLSLKGISSTLDVNPDYLGRCFKKAMNISLGQYIIQKRVTLCCMRLRDSTDRIEQIARDSGFGSRRQFYEEFKNVTKKTPAQYRTESSFIITNVL